MGCEAQLAETQIVKISGGGGKLSGGPLQKCLIEIPWGEG